MRTTIWNGCLVFLLLGAVTSSLCAQTDGKSASALWMAGEQSAGQRPIEVARFGSGSRFVLIVGNVSGNDPESVALIDAAAELSRQFPPPEPVTLLLIRTPNPDGLAEHVHTNARGVELDRNFPTRNFTLAPTRLTGPHPASEPETQYVVRVLKEFHPDRVLHLRTGAGEKPLVLLSETWRARSGGATLPQDIPQSPYHYSFKAGSLEEFADSELQSSVATVVLSKNARRLQAGELLRLAVGNLSAPQSPVANPAANATTDTVAKPAVPVTTPSIPQSMPSVNMEKTTSRSNAVELLPPPPVLAPTARPVGQSSGATSRFQELPKPPRK